ncbi:PA2169 family four-helix-bundle protein [Crateriforma spongiae]|uniref:PA2169 family four-helix-bundle protein n=1 Tax=Crateriforma spongiae TaxID=2724528 RepID=UPI0039B04F3B
MTLETKDQLNETTVKKLQQLIQANIDAYDGFRESAEEIEHSALADLFRQIAHQRSKFATELQNFVSWNGEAPETDGSVAASIHRTWIDIRGKLNGGDPHVILIEAERGEDHIKHAYEDVLKETAGSAMSDVLNAQYAIVKSGHDKIRDLRDSFKKA